MVEFRWRTEKAPARANFEDKTPPASSGGVVFCSGVLHENSTKIARGPPPTRYFHRDFRNFWNFYSTRTPPRLHPNSTVGRFFEKSRRKANLEDGPQNQHTIHSTPRMYPRTDPSNIRPVTLR